MAVGHVLLHDQAVRLERDPFVDISVPLFDFHFAARRAVGSGKEGEKIVEAAVLLNDDDDVLDRRRRFSRRCRKHRRVILSEAWRAESNGGAARRREQYERNRPPARAHARPANPCRPVRLTVSDAGRTRAYTSTEWFGTVEAID